MAIILSDYLNENNIKLSKKQVRVSVDEVIKELEAAEQKELESVESIKTNSDGDKVVECMASEYKEQSKEFKLEWNIDFKELNNFLCENTNLPLNCLQIEINEDEYTIYIFLDDGTKLVGASGDSLIALDNGEIDFKSYLDEYREDIEAIKEYEKNKGTEEFTSFEDVAKELLGRQ